eukprot:GFYU01011862.1.p3 GENE.GFYU01011862.1~~GFYU01011862.1.p3  ORF type:complete len:102 (-),score=5.35 GFYU01011862.1:150-434(-)
MPVRNLVGICILRLVLIPSILFGIMLSMKSSMPVDSLFLISVFMLCTGPTAINLNVICSLLGHSEKDLSTVLMITYPLSAITMTGWLTVCLVVF